MKILFDQGTPLPLRAFLRSHIVFTLNHMGWSLLANGQLLNQAESAGFECLVTTDKNLKYQQKSRDKTNCTFRFEHDKLESNQTTRIRYCG